ncbi:uncharacterized protein H6S33_007766 [Morchella sextelata]|jgi:hypothetical protein|uniref:uncharacterized protein n=1 Tax=Morchella sextelata TaxID=1174677 RepID=UPI001D05ABA2|nr:uncharacterized protein H6S33_007766 [Morchella sextelata]KAH0603444.1 hypothetical protein H6S33_007766 [Morchella sextelata]
MGKRKAYPDSTHEEDKGGRILRPRSRGVGSAGLSKRKDEQSSTPKKISEIPPVVLDTSNTASSPSPECLVEPSGNSLTSRQITKINILTVISKSLSGLRLRQNQLLLRRVHPDFQAYASAISRSTLLADKLLAFRTSGPSFIAIRNTLLPSVDTEVNAVFLIRWVIMRLYAFGHPDLIISLGTVKTPKDVLEARVAYKKSTGFGVNSLPAYGNVRFNPKHIPGHIEKIFNIVPELFARICEEKKMGGSVILFKRMIELIGEAGIPFHSPGSIFQWLLACDLAELDGIVAPPTARDLAKRVERSVKEKKGGSGTWDGLIKDIEEHHWPEVTEDVLTDHLERIYHGVREGLKTQENIFREQGFWYSDLEHCLCKVIRSEKY